jgi:hypothetical protein
MDTNLDSERFRIQLTTAITAWMGTATRCPGSLDLEPGTQARLDGSGRTMTASPRVRARVRGQTVGVVRVNVLFAVTGSG